MGGVALSNRLEKGDSMPGTNDPVELDKLSALLADPAQRKRFFLDPDATLDAAGINPAGLPTAFMAALKELDYSELGLISHVNRKLVEAGLVGDNIIMWPV